LNAPSSAGPQPFETPCTAAHLRALAQRVEVEANEVRIMGSKSVLLRTLVAASSAITAGFGVPSLLPKWRAIKSL
jgi:hypothetical protein